ncbi:HAD-IA family hydrolase [Herbiconiux sp. VKM Ac-2851]|uniref:HAD-IA family hydrolase n=1 Tax=Herbiconiux sp. VKM Ac-2851 TaxID=2739025 RepID=UPI001563C54E|nr:HAD-IA family hydrolase [Herbiconiux sp. VKM Ac-2851]NQX33197.1 HAD-IA family hydrolase [Herbiconiux sp. VKM Ac-2851]
MSQFDNLGSTMIIVVAGAAGSGKSTLGLELARSLGAALLDLDSLTNPVLEGLGQELSAGAHWNDPALRPVVRPARYAALRAALADQVRAGVDAVLIAPFTAELAGGPEWQQLVEAAGGPPEVVWLRASPALLAERRGLRAAARDVHVVDPPADAEPQVPHLVVDASLSTAQQLASVRRRLGGGRPLPADSPVFSRTFAAGLFDLDGTLIDSTPSVVRSWQQLAREYGLEVDLLAEGHGRPAAQVIDTFFSGEQAAEALARVTEIEVNDLDDVIALDGAAALLGSLPDEARAIVTSGTRIIATSRLRAAGLTPPAVLVTFDDVENGKPHPEPFLTAAARLGVDPASCVVFEDAPAGLAAAKAAGCTTVAIAGTHESHELDADLVVDGLFQLRVVLQPGGGFRLEPAL